MIRLLYGEKSYDDMLSRFYLIPERNGQTDRRTDGQIYYISIMRHTTFFVYVNILICDVQYKLFYCIIFTVTQRSVCVKIERRKMSVSDMF